MEHCRAIRHFCGGESLVALQINTKTIIYLPFIIIYLYYYIFKEMGPEIAQSYGMNILPTGIPSQIPQNLWPLELNLA